MDNTVYKVWSLERVTDNVVFLLHSGETIPLCDQHITACIKDVNEVTATIVGKDGEISHAHFTGREEALSKLFLQIGFEMHADQPEPSLV